MNRQTTILSGKFAGEGSKGNFTGYNAKGERIFIHKAQMEALGVKSEKDLKFPFFSIIGNKDIQTRDENGELTNVLVSRLQALSVFTTREAMLEAVNSDAMLELDAKAQLATKASAAGLAKEQITALLENPL